MNGEEPPTDGDVAERANAAAPEDVHQPASAAPSEPAPNHHPLPPVLVCARQVEYEAAGYAWFGEAVHHVMRTMDPLYASMSPHRNPMLAEELIQPTGDDQPMAVQPFRIEATGAVNVPAVIEGDLQDLHDAVANVAQQMLTQTMRAMFDQMRAVTDRVGTTIEASGDLVETFIHLLEAVDIAFDDQGEPQFQIVASPEGGDSLREALTQMTPDQIRRADQILERKREEYRATRRRRHLPRHG